MPVVLMIFRALVMLAPPVAKMTASGLAARMAVM